MHPALAKYCRPTSFAKPTKRLELSPFETSRHSQFEASIFFGRDIVLHIPVRCSLRDAYYEPILASTTESRKRVRQVVTSSFAPTLPYQSSGEQRTRTSPAVSRPEETTPSESNLYGGDVFFWPFSFLGAWLLFFPRHRGAGTWSWGCAQGLRGGDPGARAGFPTW